MNGEQLVIRIGIESGSHVDDEDHVIEVSIVCFVGIEGYGIIWVLIIRVKSKRSAANEGIADHDEGEEDEIDQDILIGGG